MRNKHITQINVYHTPDKVSKPDLQHQSHLKTTVPSVFDTSDVKKQNQFAAHYSRMRPYEFGSSNQIYSQKRPSKNQWELKEKLDQYQTQIALLHQYLRSTSNKNIEKYSIFRIFGFPQQIDRLQSQQQKVIKQLGTKVRSLIKQNSSLKTHNLHYSQLNIEEIIHQNTKLQTLLEQYKITDSLNHERLIEENQIVKDQIYRERVAYEQKIRLMQIQNQSKLKSIKANQRQLRTRMQMIQKHNQQSLRQITNQQEKLSQLKIQQLGKIHQNKLKESQLYWRKKLNDQQTYYLKIKQQWQAVGKELKIRIQSQQMKRLKQYYVNIIEDIEKEQKIKFQRLIKLLQDLQKRIGKTDDSIQHLKFQRANRIQSTIRKSHSIITHSPKPKGQKVQQEYSSGQFHEENVRINQKPLSYSLNRVSTTSPQIQILYHKITYLQKQLNEYRTKLSLAEKLISQKTQKIIILQNQLRQQNSTINNLNTSLRQSSASSAIKQKQLYQRQKQLQQKQKNTKQIIRQVPVIPKQYSQQVRNIKETIKSCNLNNFQIFETQFNEIIDQRNQMNEKLLSLKRQAKQSAKLLVLQKHLKLQRQRTKQLELHIKSYQKQIQQLKLHIIQLQNEIEKFNTQEIRRTGEEISRLKECNVGELPDGKAGLEWQRVLKHCLLTSIKRLEGLQNRMREDVNVGRGESQ